MTILVLVAGSSSLELHLIDTVAARVRVVTGATLGH